MVQTQIEMKIIDSQQIELNVLARSKIISILVTGARWVCSL